MSAVRMAFAYLIDPRTPKNSGTFRPVTVIARPGTIVNPLPPAPVTLSTNHCAQDIAEAIIKALAPAAPERAIAGWGRRFRIAIKGVNPRTKRPFIWHMFHARPGGGATAVGDGWETAGEGQAAGGIFFFSSRRRHTRSDRDWSSDVCSSDLGTVTRCSVPRSARTCPRRRWRAASRPG